MYGRVNWVGVVCAVLGQLGGIGHSAAQSAGADSARDLQTSCQLTGLPPLERASVSWRGDCRDGLAVGVGEVFMFSNGRIRYILRGNFQAGKLLTQESLRDCATGACTDDIPLSMLRQHQQSAAPSGVQPVASVSSAAQATPVVATSAALGASAPATKDIEIKSADAVYSGAFVLDPKTGRLSGEGNVKFVDGRSYVGALRDSVKTGRGTYIWTNGQRYSGQWLNDLPHGQGEWTASDGERYTGDFIAGRREGAGTMTKSDGTRYEGQWRADRNHGNGKLTFASGDAYEGVFVDGERTGKGTYRQKSGNVYTGEWLRGQRNGQGVEEWANGQRYEGQWALDRKTGNGLMRFPDGSTYEGPWNEDLASGSGDIVFASGDTYTGQVLNGLPHGAGIFRWGSGDRFEGEFDAGRPTAKGQMTFLTEAVATGNSSNGPASSSAPTRVEASVAPPPAPSAAPAAPVTRANLCFGAFNSARALVTLRRFLDSFPDDECGRHALAKQKIASIEERERNASRAIEDRIAQAKALVGAIVAFKQEVTSCVKGTGLNCERVTYVFDVKGRVREIDVQRRTAQVQVSDATSLGNEKRAPSALFAEGRSAATEAFKAKVVGGVQSKTLEEIGLAF